MIKIGHGEFNKLPMNDGDVSGNHGGADYWIIKLNSSGTVPWQRKNKEIVRIITVIKNYTFGNRV